MAYRERWFAQNITTLQFSIGDLPKVPTFDINTKIDLLEFYSKEAIEQSVNLLTCVNNGWLSFSKKLDGTVTDYTVENIAAGLTAPDGTQIGGNPDLSNYLKLDGTNAMTGDMSLGNHNINDVQIIRGITGTGLTLAGNGGNVSIAESNLVLGGGTINMGTGMGGEGGNITMDGGTIQFPNLSGSYGISVGSQIGTGTFDGGHGGNGGVSLTCIAGFELNWQAGYLSNSYNNGQNFLDIIMDRTGINLNSNNISNVNTLSMQNSITFGSAQIVTDQDGGINFIDQGGYTMQWNAWDWNGLSLNNANIWGVNTLYLNGQEGSAILFPDDTAQTTAYTGVPTLSTVLAKGSDSGGENISVTNANLVLNNATFQLDTSNSPITVNSNGAGTLNFSNVNTVNGLPGVSAVATLFQTISAGNNAGDQGITNVASITFSDSTTLYSANPPTLQSILGYSSYAEGNSIYMGNGDGYDGGVIYLENGNINFGGPYMYGNGSQIVAAGPFNVTGAIYSGVVNLGQQSGSITTADAITGNQFIFTMVNDCQVTSPYNGVGGQGILFQIIQDSITQYNLSFDTGFNLGTFSVPTLSPNTTCYVSCIFNGNNGQWDILSFLTGY